MPAGIGGSEAGKPVREGDGVGDERTEREREKKRINAEVTEVRRGTESWVRGESGEEDQWNYHRGHRIGTLRAQSKEKRKKRITQRYRGPQRNGELGRGAKAEKRIEWIYHRGHRDWNAEGTE